MKNLGVSSSLSITALAFRNTFWRLSNPATYTVCDVCVIEGGGGGGGEGERGRERGRERKQTCLNFSNVFDLLTVLEDSDNLFDLIIPGQMAIHYYHSPIYGPHICMTLSLSLRLTLVHQEVK